MSDFSTLKALDASYSSQCQSLMPAQNKDVTN